MNLADAIRAALATGPRTQAELNNLVAPHTHPRAFDDTLLVLESEGRIRRDRTPRPNGRPQITWHRID